MKLKQQPLAGSSFVNWIKLLFVNGGIDNKYITRGIYITLITFCGIPFRIMEKAKIRTQIEKTRLEECPVFIIGYWRSGTTYLHNLMSQDNSFGYVTNLQTFAPNSFLTNKQVVKIVKSSLPKKRPMDEIEVSLDSPQEEEYAMGNVSQYSFYHGWSFPKNMKKLFNNYVLFKNATPKLIIQWKNKYVEILKKASLNTKKSKLLIKNPMNTARVKILLEIFPNAKFIHIYRNPYTVYLSTKNFFKKTLEYSALQDIDEEEIEENIFLFYKELMQKFLQDKNLIPSENLVEVKYEDLEANALKEIERIYSKLNISGFHNARSAFEAYIASQSNYQKNQYDLNEKIIDKIYHHWKFEIEQWQYKVPQNIANSNS